MHNLHDAYFNGELTDLCVDLVDISHPPAKNVGCDVDSVLVPEVRSLAASPLNLRPGVTNHTSHHATEIDKEKKMPSTKCLSAISFLYPAAYKSRNTT